MAHRKANHILFGKLLCIDTINETDDVTVTSESEVTTETEDMPYDMTIDEEGNFTFKFNDWEWSLDEEALAGSGTTGTVNDKITSHLNLRSGSGTDYEIIGHLLPGEEVKVVGENGDWYEVVVPERSGYVYKDYLDVPESDDSGMLNEEFMMLLMFLMMNSFEDAETAAALTPDGNMTLVDDIGSSTEAGKQFITLVTKAGNYFYLIIDRDDEGTENVHFLNLVDEADLFALMDEEQVAAMKGEQMTTPEEGTPSTPDGTKTEKELPADQVDVDSDMTQKMPNVIPAVILVIVVLAGAGGVFFMMQTKKKKAQEKKPDPDADYTDEEEEEYLIPDEEEDVLDEEEPADSIENEEAEE